MRTGGKTILLVVLLQLGLGVGTANGLDAHKHTQLPAVTIVPGPQVRIGEPDTGTYWWAHMDHSPSKPGTIMVCGTRTVPARNAAEGYVYLSTDYGKTWREVLVDASTKWVSEHSCAFGRDGDAYFLSSRSAFFRGLPHHDKGWSYLYSSSDSGMSWNIAADWPFVDFTSTVVDTSPSSVHGPVFIFANDVNTSDPQSGPGLLAFFPPNIASLQSITIAKDGERGRLFSAVPTGSAVLENGSVIGVFRASRSSETGPRPWFNTSTVRESIEIVRSDDRGLTLNAPVPISASRGFGQLSEATIAIDHSYSRHRGRIYVCWAENFRRHIEVILATSDDGGKTWHRRVTRSLPDRERELGLGSAPGITPPAVAVNKDGVVGISWVERQGRCPYFAASLNGGDVFSANVPLVTCSPRHSTDLGWYGHYLFTWPESEANERGAQRDESRLGLRIQMRVQSLTPTSMVADDYGDFHPMWLAMRQGGSQLWTTAVRVTSDVGVRPNLPPGLTDVSPRVALEFANNDFNWLSGTLSVDVMVVNRGRVPLNGPLLLQVLGTKSTLGTLRLSENPTGNGKLCQWTPHSHLIVQRVLAPGHWSGPTRISARLHEVRRTDAGDLNISIHVCGYDTDHDLSSTVGASPYWMVTPEHR